jgi:hypothetical protein
MPGFLTRGRMLRVLDYIEASINWLPWMPFVLSADSGNTFLKNICGVYFIKCTIFRTWSGYIGPYHTSHARIWTRTLDVGRQLKEQVTTTTFASKQASQGPRCGLKVTGFRSIEAQLTSNHPMFLPPSSLDYRTEPPVILLAPKFSHTAEHYNTHLFLWACKK